MVAVLVSDKDPKRVRAGRIAARVRWGPEPRILRLDQLSPERRRIILALVALADEPGEKAADDAA